MFSTNNVTSNVGISKVDVGMQCSHLTNVNDD